ncbi:MAG: discoidin domain-containing protein [Algibacter sp.]
MRKTTFLIICFLLSFSVSQQALAQTVYVDGSFTGTSDGTASAPYKTIGDALTARDLAGVTGMTSDEEIIVSGGTYTPSTVSESGYITSTNGGYGSYWLTLKAADGETVILDGANLYDDKFAALITITSGATNVKVDGFTLKNQRNNSTLTTTENGVTVKDVKFGIQVGNYVTNVEITNNEIYDFSWTSAVDPMTSRTSFTSAEIAILSAAVGGDNIGAISVVGTSLTAVTGLVISNNYIHNIIPGWTEGIQVNGNVNGFEISDNTIDEVQNIGIVAAGHYAWVEAIDGATVTSALNQARNGVISGNKVTSCRSPIAAAAGIYCDGSANVTVENNEASDGQVGFSIGNENTSSNSGNHIVRNNVAYDNAWAGFLFGVPDAAGNSYIDNVSVTGNTSFRNGGVIDTYLGSMGQSEVIINKNINNLTIENNIFYSPNHANLISISAAFTTGYEAYYNTMSFDYNTYYSDITTSGATGIFDLSQAGLGWYGTFAYYQASNTLSLDQNSQFSDPLFTNTTSGSVDLSLQSTSPAIDAGNPAYTVSTGETDILGNDRIASSIVDAGAYEYGSTSSSTAVNLALSGTATQSSTAYDGVASRAIDGDTNGAFSGGSVTHTNSEANAWWQVDLGADQSIGEINVYNRTDCCSSRLTNFTVYVINSSGTTTYSQSFTSTVTTSISLNAGAVLGKIIKIQLDETNVLSLSEVQVYEGAAADNLATSGTATQSSTAYSGVASRAIDGDTNGDWSNASVTHTNSEANAWWQVDLGADKNIGVINVFNRTNCCSSRLTNFTVYVINSSGTTTYSKSFTSYPDPSIVINAGDVLGKVIKVQLDDTNSLSLAELEVYSYVTSTSTSKVKAEKISNFNTSRFSIYPNPSAEIINLTGVIENDTIEIYNIFGTLVLKTRDTQINISDLPKGIYLAKTLKQNAVKFIKK